MGIRFRVTGSEVADFDERSIVNAEFCPSLQRIPTLKQQTSGWA